MIDLIIYVGAGICFVVGGFGIFFAVFACSSYIFDYFIKKWKGYRLLADFVFNYSKFKQWKKQK